MRSRHVICVVVVWHAVFVRSLRSSLKNWHSARNEYLLTRDRQPKPPPVGSAQLYGTFRSLRAMLAIFKAGLRVQQE